GHARRRRHLLGGDDTGRARTGPGRAVHARRRQRRTRPRRSHRVPAGVADGRAGVPSHGIRRGHSVSVPRADGAAGARRFGLGLARCFGFAVCSTSTSSVTVSFPLRTRVLAARRRSRRTTGDTVVPGLVSTYGSAIEPLTVKSTARVPSGLVLAGSERGTGPASADKLSNPREFGTSVPS